MKPNFALSLSFEGIRLLHRAAGGWRVVGDVGLDAADLAGELAMLRRTAVALDPSGLRTKVLLPSAQIKYLTIDTDGRSGEALQDAARAALEGATPYPVDDLAFDISADGAQTHVAAVARETLVEAEGFAAEHQFNPVSFAAIPEDAPYLGEPFFGPTLAAKSLLAEGEQVEADGIAVVVIGDISANDGPVVEVPDGTPEVVQDAPLQEPAGLDVIPATEGAEPSAVAPEAPAETVEPLPPTATDAPKADEIEPVLPVFKSRAAPPVVEQTAAEGLAPKTPAPVTAPESTPSNDINNAAEASEKTVVMPTLGPARAAEHGTKAPPVGAPPVAAPPVAAPEGAGTGFASRRGNGQRPSAPARQEPQVAAPSLPQDPAVAADSAALAAQSSAATAPQIAPAAEPAFASRAAAPIAAAAGAAAATGRFLSKRGKKAAAAIAAPIPATATTAPPRPQTEADRMTVFGARSTDVGGKPRFLALILVAALLVFLAGVAAWASVFLDDGLNLSRFFGERTPRATASAPLQPTQTTADAQGSLQDPAAPADAGTPLRGTAQELVQETVQDTAPQDPQDPGEAAVVTASLAPDLPDGTTTPETSRQPTPTPEFSDQKVQAIYATSGVWAKAPDVPPEPAGLVNIDDLYLTSVDPRSTTTDAIALPSVNSFSTDLELGTRAAPAAAGTTFALNSAGLVVATANGALAPGGYTVFLGRPAALPPAVALARAQITPREDALRSALAGQRPKFRPKNLSEKNQRARLGGLSRPELAGFRPKLRAKSAQQAAEQVAKAKAAEKKAADAKAAELAKAEAEKAKTEAAKKEAAKKEADEAATKTAAVVKPPEPAKPEVAKPAGKPAFENATRLAAKASARPDARPRNFKRIVSRAKRAPTPKPETRVASTKQVAPRVVKPKNPTKSSVAKQATVKNAINLRKVNLIGVYGKPSNRRALVRLSNGRYKKVTVGDRIDGGRVRAIGTSELRYSKGGRNVTLKMPRG